MCPNQTARSLLTILTMILTTSLAGSSVTYGQSPEVVAFWSFSDPDYVDAVADDTITKLDFAADVDNTAAGTANLQAFRAQGEDLDNNGGGSSFDYTSATSNIFYAATRTVKWDDLAGGGDDFDINGTDSFQVSKGGDPAEADDFGNDALMYITFDGSEFEDLQFRFDAEGTPETISPSFDVFYRFGGPTGTWFREAGGNNIPLNFQDYDPVDPDNQFADTGLIALSSDLNNQSQVELIFNDFNEDNINNLDGNNEPIGGNGELEIDNFEIVGVRTAAVPEPSAVALLIGGTIIAAGRRRRH